MRIITSEAWRAAYPGAAAGFLAMDGVANPSNHPGLQRHMEAAQAALRSRFGGDLDLGTVPEIQAYRAYYRRFDKTYHVELQLQSVVRKGKSMHRPGALVAAMFSAELKNLLLTAGHDLDRLEGPVTVDVSRGDERYVTLAGREQVLKPGDMCMRDAEGILSSVLYGPDRRTRLGPGTRRALFAVYAPAGVGADRVHSHLQDLADAARLVSPEAEVEALEVLSA